MLSAAEIASRLTRAYEKAIYTREEAIAQIVEAAATVSTAELAEAIPGDWLADVKAKTVDPPPSPEDVVFLYGALFRDGTDCEAYYAERRRLWDRGAWNWRRFFG